MPEALRSGWEAIDTGAALIDGGGPSLLVATGEERLEFLHGQTSNDVLGLAPGAGCAALSLTAQGRPVAMFALYNDAEHERVLIAMPAAQRTDTRAALERFLVADDCEFEDAADLQGRTLAGPEAAAVLRRAGVELLDDEAAGWRMRHATIAGRSALVLARGDLRVPAFDIVAADPQLQPAFADPVWDALRAAGAAVAGADALDVVRVESGTARFGVDVDDTRIAIEARLEWAIHFGKGCYVGQEVIERAVSRGRIQHTLELLSAPTVVAGARVSNGGPRDVATSVVESPRLGRIALAYLPAEAADTGRTVQLSSDAGTHDATVLPWPRPRRLAGRE
ncbi:MAG TPA: hypothetical protein VEL28_17520 [Candidatus Binatia bacterium]|nr:hypothetical protein [Candidatus Binatia bacterium]